MCQHFWGKRYGATSRTWPRFLLHSSQPAPYQQPILSLLKSKQATCTWQFYWTWNEWENNQHVEIKCYAWIPSSSSIHPSIKIALRFSTTSPTTSLSAYYAVYLSIAHICSISCYKITAVGPNRYLQAKGLHHLTKARKDRKATARFYKERSSPTVRRLSNQRKDWKYLKIWDCGVRDCRNSFGRIKPSSIGYLGTKKHMVETCQKKSILGWLCEACNTRDEINNLRIAFLDVWCNSMIVLRKVVPLNVKWAQVVDMRKNVLPESRWETKAKTIHFAMV